MYGTFGECINELWNQVSAIDLQVADALRTGDRAAVWMEAGVPVIMIK